MPLAATAELRSIRQRVVALTPRTPSAAAISPVISALRVGEAWSRSISTP